MHEDLQKPEKLLFLLARVGRLITASLQQQLPQEHAKLIGPPMGILADLANTDGVRQQDLAVAMIIDKATITRSLQHLETENLVIRTDDPIDKRSKRIFLTPTGRKLMQELAPFGRNILSQACHGVSAEDRTSCQKVLQDMYDNLQMQLHTQPNKTV